MEYLKWNDLIASCFFSPEKAGQNIHLCVARDTIEALGKPYGKGFQDFVSALKEGPPWATHRGICQKALQAEREWRRRGREYPPYIGYLAFFVVASGIEGDFSPHAYYPRLRSLLGEEDRVGQYPSFDRMLELWDDLERWSYEDKDGETGFFNISIVGNWIHVGPVIAQALLTEKERANLPVIFAKGGLSPTFPPSDRELARIISQCGNPWLRSWVTRVLAEEEGNDGELRLALIENLADELREWDGSAPIQVDSEKPIPQSHGNLKICLQADLVTECVYATLHCATNNSFPQEGIRFSIGEGNYSCEDLLLGWSSAIRREESGDDFDASSIPWERGFHFRDSTGNWRFSLPGSSVRIFVDGSVENLPGLGLVEVRRLPENQPFFIACHERVVGLVQKWGEKGCEGCEERAWQGFPQGWHLFHINRAVSDRLVRDCLPILSFPITTQLFFTGGIRITGANCFFKFAPPMVKLQGTDPDTKLFWGDKLLKTGIDGLARLAEDTPTSVRIVIEARRGDSVIRRRALYIEDDFILPTSEDMPRFDTMGREISEDNFMGAKISGAIVKGITPSPFPFSEAIQLNEGEKAYLIGRSPGQVVIWPDERKPDGWMVIWKLVFSGRGKSNVQFCGMDLTEAEPLKQKWGDKRQQKLWKKIIWHDRKRVAAINNRHLGTLWERYKKIARMV
jgi:hypothetical protein